MASKRLALNPLKSEFLWCASPRRTHLIDNSAFVLPDGSVNASSSVRNLGVYFDESLSITDHINRLVRLCFYQLRRIRFIRRSLTVAVATRLVNSFIIARIDFCNSILAGLPRYQISRIQSILNVAARLIYGHSRCQHITPTLRDRLHWLRVPERIVFKSCLLVYRALHGLTPAHISSNCIEASSRRFLRSSTHWRLVVSPPDKIVMLVERSFAVGGPSLWNQLPDTVKAAENVESFKKRLKTLIWTIVQLTDFVLISVRFP